jgi:hypothetical protein
MGQVVRNYLQKSTAMAVPELLRAASNFSGGWKWRSVAVLPERASRLQFVAVDRKFASEMAMDARSWRSDEPVVHGFELKCLADKDKPSRVNGGVC